MNLNNKGFAISSVMYALLILALSLMFGILAILVSRKMTLDKIKDKVKETVNGDVDSISDKYKGLEPRAYNEGDQISYANLNWVVVKDNGDSDILVLEDKIEVTDNKYTNYKTILENFIDNNVLLKIAKTNEYLVSMTFTGGTGYIRALELTDIYGENQIPTELSKEKSVITNCKFCIEDYTSYLLNESANKNYTITYDEDDKVIYLSTSSGAGYIRPVITLKETE